jgi:hypothetical protein
MATELAPGLIVLRMVPWVPLMKMSSASGDTIDVRSAVVTAGASCQLVPSVVT